MGGKQAELDRIKHEFNCHKCGNPGYKTDGQSRVWCASCLGIHDEEYINSYPKFKGTTIVRDSPKQGRNELCLCGSGKKYKKCCLPVVKVKEEKPATKSSLENLDL